MQVQQIDNQHYLIPKEVLNKSHKHRKKDNWVKLWFYKNRKITEVKKEHVKIDKQITSKLEYQKNVFYKMTQISYEDDCFDYYFKLKDDFRKKNIVKKNSRFKNQIPNTNKKALSLHNDYCYKKPYRVCPETGKFIVSFD
jgi:hypothetical protein